MLHGVLPSEVVALGVSESLLVLVATVVLPFVEVAWYPEALGGTVKRTETWTIEPETIYIYI